MCRLSWKLRASTSWNPQDLSRDCFTKKLFHKKNSSIHSSVATQFLCRTAYCLPSKCVHLTTLSFTVIIVSVIYELLCSNGAMISTEVKWRTWGKINLSQGQFVHHKSHMDWPSINPRSYRVTGRRLTAWAMAYRIPILYHMHDSIERLFSVYSMYKKLPRLLLNVSTSVCQCMKYITRMRL